MTATPRPSIVQRRRSARIASCASRCVSGAISLAGPGNGSITGGVPGLATPLAADDAPPSHGIGSVFGPAARGRSPFDATPDTTGGECGGDEIDESRPPMSIGVAAAVRVASLEPLDPLDPLD